MTRAARRIEPVPGFPVRTATTLPADASTRIASCCDRLVATVFGRDVTSNKDAVAEIAMTDWIAARGDSSVVITLGEGKAVVLVAIDKHVIAAISDRDHGGAAETGRRREPMSRTELRTLHRIAAACGEAVSDVWPNFQGARPRCHESAGAADIASGARMIGIEANVSGSDGQSHTLSLAVSSSFFGDIAPADATSIALPEWHTRLCRAVLESRHRVNFVIARPTLSLDRLTRLREGDFIPIVLPARVPMSIGGYRLASGTIGESDGRAALRVERLEAGVYDA